eukprot:5727779-Amphidinium_carterae.1
MPCTQTLTALSPPRLGRYLWTIEDCRSLHSAGTSLFQSRRVAPPSHDDVTGWNRRLKTDDEQDPLAKAAK